VRARKGDRWETTFAGPREKKVKTAHQKNHVGGLCHKEGRDGHRQIPWEGERGVGGNDWKGRGGRKKDGKKGTESVEDIQRWHGVIKEPGGVEMGPVGRKKEFIRDTAKPRTSTTQFNMGGTKEKGKNTQA